VDPVIITVAPVGGELTREQQPNLPLTPEQIGEEVRRSAEAGASIVHVHGRDASGLPTQSAEAYRRIIEAIRDRCDVVIQTSTGGSVGMTEQERAEPLDLGPEMASLTTGSVNFGDEVFLNPPSLVERFFLRMRERDILPEFEVFDTGMVDSALGLVEAHDREHHHLHFDFVLGVAGGMRGSPESVSYLASLVPDRATWSATGIGRTHLPVTLAALAMNGNVRTGFEDTIYYSKGVLAASNAELVGRVARLAEEAGRTVATPEEARRILGLKGGP
jgi:3-keto-5-aminohexanoate cleavage enzyme